MSDSARPPELPGLIAVCGTDTDAGKTVVTAALLRAALKPGFKAQALKPVQTGCARGPAGQLNAPDVEIYRRAAPLAQAAALRTFAEACSPHLAAERAGESLEAASLAAQVLEAAAAYDLTLVEGAGGVLTPLNRRENMADLFAALADSARPACPDGSVPVLLVVGNKLGAVNHALLSLEALRQRGLHPFGFVLVNLCPPAEIAGETAAAILRDNPRIIAEQGRISCLAELPYCPDLAPGSAAWAHLAEALLPVLRFSGANGPQAECAAQLDFDRDHLWHPYTSALHPLKTWQATATRGPYIWLRDRKGHGYRVLDGMSSWWAAIHGYNHPRLLEALHAQAAKMPHVMFGGISHAPAARLGQKLLQIAPPGLEHVFFADSGSVAVEVALKMALQYQVAAGKPEKSRLLTVYGGYHGDTLGCMSVCDPVNGMHSLFSATLPGQIFAPRPDCPPQQPFDPACLEPLREILRDRAGEIAALIIEPIVQGAGGMRFYHPGYLRGLRELCNEYGCLLILDEIATGFGRTGRMFACEWAGIAPDIMCVGKGLTGGVMTLAATLASAEVARGLSRSGGVLMHGPTFMANPLACAVALASLELLEETPWRENVARIEAALENGLAGCRALPGVAEVRVFGAIGVVEMKAAVPQEPVQDYLVREHGVWLRPFGKLIYLMPPYISTNEDLQRLCRAVCAAAARLEDGTWV